jgi:hypothetical protein
VAQRVRRPEAVGVGEGDDLAGRALGPGVLGDDLPAARARSTVASAEPSEATINSSFSRG